MYEFSYHLCPDISQILCPALVSLLHSILIALTACWMSCRYLKFNISKMEFIILPTEISPSFRSPYFFCWNCHFPRYPHSYLQCRHPQLFPLSHLCFQSVAKSCRFYLHHISFVSPSFYSCDHYLAQQLPKWTLPSTQLPKITFLKYC